MKCPSCGADNPDDNKFCHRCGKEIPENPEPNVIGHRCPKCGTENRVGLSYCSKCGANLEGAEPIFREPEEEESGDGHDEKPRDTPKPQPKKTNGKRNVAIAAVAALLLIVVAVGAGLMMGGDEDDRFHGPLDDLKTPDGTYTFDAEITANGQTVKTTVKYTIRNDELISYSMGGVAVTGAELQEIIKENVELSKIEYTATDGPTWHNSKGECETYLITYKGISATQVVSKEGVSLYEESYNDGVRTKMTLQGWSEGYLMHTITFLDSDGKTLSTKSVRHGYGFDFPDPGTKAYYTFDGWKTSSGGTAYKGGQSYGSVNSDLTFTAYWTPVKYTVSVNQNIQGGTVTGTGTFVGGTNVKLTVTPLHGYVFDGWYVNGSAVSTQKTYSFTLTANKTVEAKYHYQVFTVNVQTNYPDCGVSGSGSYNYLTEITLKTTGKTGYTFVGWYNGTTKLGTTATYNLKVTDDMTIVAKYSLIHDSSFTMSTASISSGTAITVNPSYQVGVSERTVNIVEMVSGDTRSSSVGAGTFTIIQSDPEVLRITVTTKYTDGYIDIHSEYLLIDGQYSVGYNWHYQVTTWYSDLTPWLNNREASRTMTGDYLEYYQYLMSNVPRNTSDALDNVSKLVTPNDPNVKVLANSLLSETSGCKDVEKVGCALKFVQSIPFENDYYSRGTSDWWKTPLETLTEKRGDYADHAVLLASLLEAMGFDCVLLKLVPNDSDGSTLLPRIVVGVNVSGASGTSITLEGTKYYYCEPTADVGGDVISSYEVGVKPDGYKTTEYFKC